MSRNALRDIEKTAEREATGSTVNRNFKTTTFKWSSSRTPQTSAKRSKLSVPAAGNPQSKGSWQAVLFTIQIHSPHMRERKVLESGKFLLVESGIQIKESGIGIQNPSSTNKDWNPVQPSTWNPESTAWSSESRLGLSWIEVTYDESILKGKWEMVKLTTNPCSAVFSLWVACENIRFSTLFAAGDVSPARNVPSGEERGETDVFAG